MQPKNCDQQKPSKRTRWAVKPALLFVLFTLIAVFTVQTPASANPRYASIVMDADPGLILHQRYADKVLHPASLTKVMTLLLVFDGIQSGRFDLNDRVPISSHAASMVPSKLGLAPGSSIRVKDAISALVTKSANDIAVALAEYVGGSEKNFARMMTRKARSIGMSRTIFRNASGLHDEGQVTTARDLLKMARVVIQQYPEEYKYFSLKNFTYQGKSYHNHNRLMSTYKGMDGMKTGYVQASGFNLIASAVRNDRRLIGVVLGGRSSYSRNAHMAKLLDQGFARINTMMIATANVPVPPRKPPVIMALAALSKLSPASGQKEEVGNTKPKVQYKWASLNPALQSGMFGTIIGEGDSDPAVSRRIETGLMAISAHKGSLGVSTDNTDALALAPQKLASYTPQMKTMQRSGSEDWAIQIGAFTSRMTTDQALRRSMKSLPARYAAIATASIAPLKTGDSWLFRGRLTGFNEQDAAKACTYLSECLLIAPQNY